LVISKKGKRFPRLEKDSHAQEKIPTVRKEISIFRKEFPRSEKKLPYLEKNSHAQEKIPTLRMKIPSLTKIISIFGKNFPRSEKKPHTQ
jgi:hypothetical protein